MALRYLLDTNIVSEPFQKQPRLPLLERIRAHQRLCAICSVTWQELVFGVVRLPASKRRRLFEQALATVHDSFPILPFDEREGRWQAEQRVRLRNSTPPYADTQIAAVAATSGLIMVTLNLKHFRPFEAAGLVVEDWSAP